MVFQGNTKKWSVLVALFFAMVAAGEIWDIRGTSAAPAERRILRMIRPEEPGVPAMSPIAHYNAGMSSAEPIFSNIMESLVDIDQKRQIIPKLATRWEHSPDLTKWRFYLRRGVKFHNGDSFTARDVVELAKWSLKERKLSRLYRVVPIKEAVAVDDYTVELIFEKSQPLLLLAIRGMAIVPSAIIRDNPKMFETHPIGTGPYRFVEWNKGRNIKFTKFEGYWGLKPQIDDVVITFRKEEGVRLAALRAGEVDWIEDVNLESAAVTPKVARMASPDVIWLHVDEYIQKELGGVSILADKRLRLAVDYAIDRQTVSALYNGYVTLSLGQLASPGDFGFNPNLKNRPYDLEKAKALVRESGAVGKTVSLVAPSDRLLKAREMAEAIAFMIEKTGLKVKLMLMPQEEASKYKKTQGENRKYAADMVIQASDFLLEVESRFSQFFTENSEYSATLDLEPTKLYKEVVSEVDYAKRAEKLAKAWAYVYEQAHYIPVFAPDLIWGLAKNLEWELDPSGRAIFAKMRFTD